MVSIMDVGVVVTLLVTLGVDIVIDGIHLTMLVMICYWLALVVMMSIMFYDDGVCC